MIRKASIEEMKKEGLTSTSRMFVGKNYRDEMGLFINDTNSRARIMLYVDIANQPKIEMPDENGVETP